ncbi:hypothetical protein AZE41_19335 [Sporosarcina psychrophila]|nr:hypothetical protein AZE41_19335 [Sporosarcina psychrophila]
MSILLRKAEAPGRRDGHKSIQRRSALCYIAGLLMTRAAGAWSLDNKKSGRRLVDPTSAGGSEDKGVICL